MISFLVTYNDNGYLRNISTLVLTNNFTNNATLKVFDNDNLVGTGTFTSGVWNIDADVFIPARLVPSNSIIQGVSASSDIDTYTVSTLPLASTKPVGFSAILTGNFAPDVTQVLLTVDLIQGNKAWTGSIVSSNEPPESSGLPDGVLWEVLS